MDFLEAERERGITIQSACVSFFHKESKINLIDTPGHADFNFEVERSLRVLDGALVIIDTIKGVEAQTHTVVKQANKYEIPKIFIFNKMDQEGAEFEQAIKSVEDKFEIKCIPLSVPIMYADKFIGALDTVHQRILFWKDISMDQFNINDIPKSNIDHPQVTIEVDSNKFIIFAGVELSKLKEDSNIFGYNIDLNELLNLQTNALEEIVMSLATDDTYLLEDFINDDFSKHISSLPKKIANLLKNYPNKYSLSYPCSALKFRNIQQIMDGIVDYFPAPKPFISDFDLMFEKFNKSISSGNKLSKDKFKSLISKSTIFFVFKRQIDQELGHMAFGRMYSGSLKYGMNLTTLYSGINIKIGNMYKVMANELSLLQTVEEGDIVCLNVPESLKSGDYLISQDKFKGWSHVLPETYSKIKPVFITSLDFESAKDRQ